MLIPPTPGTFVTDAPVLSNNQWRVTPPVAAHETWFHRLQSP
jgi:hypothetical protein